MKLKPARIIIQSTHNIKREWKAALNGKVRSTQHKNVIIINGLNTLSKIFAKRKMEILTAIITNSPKSIYELAKSLGRDFRNVHADVHFLSEIGLIELQESHTSRKGLIPVAKFSGVELDLVG